MRMVSKIRNGLSSTTSASPCLPSNSRSSGTIWLGCRPATAGRGSRDRLVDRVRRTEIARRVREVAQEALALVEDLLRRQRELAGLRDRAAGDRDAWPPPTAARGAARAGAAARGRSADTTLPSLKRISARRGPRARRSTHGARDRRHRAQHVEEAVELGQQALAVVAVGVQLGDVDDVADERRRAQISPTAPAARAASAARRRRARGSASSGAMRRAGAAMTSSAGCVGSRSITTASDGRAGAGQLDGAAEVRGARDLAPLALEPVRQRLESVQVGIDQDEA